MHKTNHMKKLLSIALFGLAIAMTTLSGCVKTSDSTGGSGPDVSIFLLTKASSVIAGLQSNITVSSASLGSGTFTIHYNLSGLNSGTNLSAVLNMSGGIGTFQTQAFTATGATTVTVTSITNSANQTTSIMSNNSIAVSTGAMSFTKSGATVTSDEVHTGLAGSLLSIEGIKWDPLTTINLYIDSYYSAPVVVNFTQSSFNGSAHYTAPGVAQIANYGNITITSVSPYITGTFSFTNPDSSKIMSGTFTAPMP